MKALLSMNIFLRPVQISIGEKKRVMILNILSGAVYCSRTLPVNVEELNYCYVYIFEK